MRRFQVQTPDDYERQARRRARRISRLIILGLALLVSPLVYEWGLITQARWQGVVGQERRVETPILDTICTTINEFQSEFGGFSTSAFRQIQWKPSKIVPMAFAFAALGAWFLRRGM